LVAPRWTALLIALLLWRAPSAAAQQPAPDSTLDRASAVGSIRGEVFDSLIGQRLEGAHVRVVGTALRATTDRQGRFRLDSVLAGSRVLVVDHPALDSAGLSDLPRRVQVAAGRTTQVTLAVPSLRTFAAAACGLSPAPPGRDSGIVFGAVRDAERGVRLAGAQVVMSWVAVERTRRPPRVRRPVRDVLTDSLGNYYVCAVPGSVGLGVQATTGTFASGELQLEVGERRVLRYDLSVSREALPGAADTVPGSRRGLATLVGTVGRADGGPVEGALASVPGAPADALADAAGRFVLSDLPSGSQMLFVRRIGYGFSATPVELRNRDTTRVSLALRVVTILDTIRVTATRWVRSEIDELERRLSRASVSRVLTADDLRAAGSIRTVFYGFPSLTVQTRAGGFNLYMSRGARLCSPAVWLDGWRSDSGVLDAYRPADLIALEVYPPGDVPMRYQDFGSCGVVLAWTRYLR
jgi:hypothetical protein